MEGILKQPLTTLQLELLKLFSRDVDEKDLLEIKNMLALYFANKATSLADKVWEKNNWNEIDETNFLNEHLRTSYPTK